MGGTHRLDGVLIAQGKAFKNDTEIKGACLIDMAPTLLHLMGQPVPDDMDGRVLVDLFKPEFIAKNPVRIGGSGGPEAKSTAEYSPNDRIVFPFNMNPARSM